MAEQVSWEKMAEYWQKRAKEAEDRWDEAEMKGAIDFNILATEYNTGETVSELD